MVTAAPACKCSGHMVYPGDTDWPNGYTGKAFFTYTIAKDCPIHTVVLADTNRCHRCRRPRDNHKAHDSLCPICLLEECNA